MAQKNRVTLTIFGEQYAVISSASAAHLRRLASLVDEQMRRIAARSPRLAPAKVAVLAALSLANEVLRLGGGWPEAGEQAAEAPRAAVAQPRPTG
ncbi:MAG: cell division protein ZapA, partial [Acetobacteraceae bacterium]|nr:cell division protein ZapA [Acetobacteraceae bacterium]